MPRKHVAFNTGYAILVKNHSGNYTPEVSSVSLGRRGYGERELSFYNMVCPKQEIPAVLQQLISELSKYWCLLN
jgi:hypothetical protein